jgi:hypothetical protein
MFCLFISTTTLLPFRISKYKSFSCKSVLTVEMAWLPRFWNVPGMSSVERFHVLQNINLKLRPVSHNGYKFLSWRCLWVSNILKNI